MKIVYAFSIALFCLVAACQPPKDQPVVLSAPVQNRVVPLPAPTVKVAVVKKSDFQKQLASNGKLAAYKKTDLRFSLDYKIDKIYKYNGDRVAKGDLLASLESEELGIQYEQSKMQFARAKLDLADALIGLGHDLADSANIPSEILAMAKLRSGYTQAKSEFVMAKYNFQQRHLYAPIKGVVANMFAKAMNTPPMDAPFCTIIDNRQFQIDFPIMESELFLVKPWQKIEVRPYHDHETTAKGYVKYINPVIDENGLVTVTAVVNNTNGKLYEGMNVKIMVSQKLANQLAVPKQAVTKRSGKDVIFTYRDGHAQWNYVTIGGENNDRAIISDGLVDGDTVITEGNLHLAHLAKVSIANNEMAAY